MIYKCHVFGAQGKFSLFIVWDPRGRWKGKRRELLQPHTPSTSVFSAAVWAWLPTQADCFRFDINDLVESAQCSEHQLQKHVRDRFRISRAHARTKRNRIKLSPGDLGSS